MGKVIISLSKLSELSSTKKGPNVFRLIAQIYSYDPSSGLLDIRGISDSSKHSKIWTVDVNYALQEMKCDCANFMPGTIVNIDAVYREKDGFLVASDIYELRQPELILQNMETLREIENL